MFATVTSVALVGVEPRPVRVEVHIGAPKDRFALVGLPDTAVREAKDRVRSAIVQSGFTFPNRTVTVNLDSEMLSIATLTLLAELRRAQLTRPFGARVSESTSSNPQEEIRV